MVSSADASDGLEVDSLELMAGSGPETDSGTATDSGTVTNTATATDSGTAAQTAGPEVHTLTLDGPPPAPVPASPGAPLPAEPAGDPEPDASTVLPDGVYRGDGDEIDLLETVDPEPPFEPALIDTDDESMAMVIDPPGTEVEAAPVEVEDTLMAVDDYGDVL